MRFNGLTKGFFILIGPCNWAFFDDAVSLFLGDSVGRDPDHHFQPGENKLRTALGDRNGLASLLTLGIICLIVFIPLMVILSSLAVELNMVYTSCNRTTRSSRK